MKKYILTISLIITLLVILVLIYFYFFIFLKNENKIVENDINIGVENDTDIDFDVDDQINTEAVDNSIISPFEESDAILLKETKEISENLKDNFLSPIEIEEAYLVLKKAADALEGGDINEALKYYLFPEIAREVLGSNKEVWYFMARGFRNLKIVKADSEQIRLECQLQMLHIDFPEELGTLFHIYLIRGHDGSWLLNNTPVKYFGF